MSPKVNGLLIDVDILSCTHTRQYNDFQKTRSLFCFDTILIMLWGEELSGSI